MSAPTNERIEGMIETGFFNCIRVNVAGEGYSIASLNSFGVESVSISSIEKFLVARNYTLRAFLDPAPKDPDYLAEKFGVKPGSYESDLVTAIQRVVAAKIGGGK